MIRSVFFFFFFKFSGFCMQTDLEGSECGNVKLFHEFRQARMLVGTIVVETVVPGERNSIL